MHGVRRVKRALLVFAAVLSKPTNGQFLTGDRQKHALLNLSHGFAVDVGIVSAGWFVLNRGEGPINVIVMPSFPPFS